MYKLFKLVVIVGMTMYVHAEEAIFQRPSLEKLKSLQTSCPTGQTVFEDILFNQCCKNISENCDLLLGKNCNCCQDNNGTELGCCPAQTKINSSGCCVGEGWTNCVLLADNTCMCTRINTTPSATPPTSTIKPKATPSSTFRPPPTILISSGDKYNKLNMFLFMIILIYLF
jgi:hypothetical protein